MLFDLCLTFWLGALVDALFAVFERTSPKVARALWLIGRDLMGDDLDFFISLG